MPKKVVRGGEESIQITVRVGASVIDRADELVEYLSGLRGIPAARADVYREALLIGLKTLKEKADKASG
jgi:hypothetical protein